MSHIRTQIDNLFPNYKVGELFSNSDGGQGVIDAEIDRYFSFEQIEECLIILTGDRYLKFLRDHDNHSNLKQFFKRLEKRMREILSIYQESITNEYILNLVNKNKPEIIKKYPNISSSKDAQLFFAKEYIKKHKELKDNTFEQVKDFFENPVAWI